MFIASIAHFYIFPYHEWQQGYSKEKKQILIDETLAVRDFISDFRKVVSRWENSSSSSAGPLMIDIEEMEHDMKRDDVMNESSHSERINHMILSSPRTPQTPPDSVLLHELETVWRDFESRPFGGVSSSSSTAAATAVPGVVISDNHTAASWHSPYQQSSSDSGGASHMINGNSPIKCCIPERDDVMDTESL